MLTNLLEATLAENMANGAFTFVLGMCVIFLGMITLVLAVSLLGRVVSKPEKTKDVEPKVEKVVSAPVVEESSDEIPEDVKVAIITAISAYYMSNGTKAKNEFTVRKIKKI